MYIPITTRTQGYRGPLRLSASCRETPPPHPTPGPARPPLIPRRRKMGRRWMCRWRWPSRPPVCGVRWKGERVEEEEKNPVHSFVGVFKTHTLALGIYPPMHTYLSTYLPPYSHTQHTNLQPFPPGAPANGPLPPGPHTEALEHPGGVFGDGAVRLCEEMDRYVGERRKQCTFVRLHKHTRTCLQTYRYMRTSVYTHAHTHMCVYGFLLTG